MSSSFIYFEWSIVLIVLFFVMAMLTPFLLVWTMRKKKSERGFDVIQNPPDMKN